MKLTIALNAIKGRVFSGIQPTGAIHLGNYFGAVQQWSRDIEAVGSHEDRLQRIYSVVDLHAITMPHDPKVLQDNITVMVASLVGCGLDPTKAVLFQQSRVAHHTELCWILGCYSTVTSLRKLTQYREKSAKLKEAPLGLFLYPLLQAADILLYKAEHVPVGEDNVQNIEYARGIARAFNSKAGHDTFPVPEAKLVGGDAGQRVKSLRHPANKMSKSDNDSRGCLFVTDSPDDVREKVKKAVTDNISHLSFDPVGRPGVSNLLSIHSQIVGKSTRQICEEHDNVDTGQYKMILADVIVEHFAPFRKRINDLLKNRDHLEAVLTEGAQTASEIAQGTITEVKKIVGFCR